MNLPFDRAAYNKKWREENIDRVRALKRKHYQKHKKRLLEYKRKHREKNKETYAERGRLYYIKNKDSIRKRWRIWNRKRKEVKASRPRPIFCECCGNSNGKTLHWDHDHNTGKFRGWLCMNCNSGIGYAKDSIERLRMMIAYLEKYEESGRIT